MGCGHELNLTYKNISSKLSSFISRKLSKEYRQLAEGGSQLPIVLFFLPQAAWSRSRGICLEAKILSPGREQRIHRDLSQPQNVHSKYFPICQIKHTH